MRGSVTVLLVAGIAMVGVLSWMSSEDKRIQEEREMRERIKAELLAELRAEAASVNNSDVDRPSTHNVKEGMALAPTATFANPRLQNRDGSVSNSTFKQALLEEYQALKEKLNSTDQIGRAAILLRMDKIRDSLTNIEASENSAPGSQEIEVTASQARSQNERLERLEENLEEFRRRQQEVERQQRELESQSGPRYGYN